MSQLSKVYFFCAMVMIMGTSLSLAEEKSVEESPAATPNPRVFIYEEHNKRDPLWPLVSEKGAILNYDTNYAISDLELEGIVVGDNNKNLAIINGKIVATGDKLGEFGVEKITQDIVVLVQGNERFELKLKKEGNQ